MEYRFMIDEVVMIQPAPEFVEVKIAPSPGAPVEYQSDVAVNLTPSADAATEDQMVTSAP